MLLRFKIVVIMYAVDNMLDVLTEFVSVSPDMKEIRTTNADHLTKVGAFKYFFSKVPELFSSWINV